MADPPPVVWRTIDDLAHAVGHYCWIEHRVFEVAGAWAGLPAEGGADAEVRVWCAAVSRRHGALARAWAERLPVRAGVDPAALVVSPPGRLAEAFEDLEAVSDPLAGAAVLAGPVLSRLDELYARLLETTSPVTEAPVAEVLVAARHALAGERASAAAWPRGMQAWGGASAFPGDAFEQAFEEMGIFPAVRPS